MFGIFSKKRYQPTVTSEDKEWIENRIIWFIEAFGLDKLKEQPFILPTKKNFPYNNLSNSDQFQKLFEQICNYCEVNPNEISVKFFDDYGSKQWTTWIPLGEFNEPAGVYNQIYPTDEKRFNIELAKSNLNNPQLLVSVIAHELAHVKLLGENYINYHDEDMEPLTDLACIFFGFGVFVANSVQTQDINWIKRSGYLPNQVISYANALICYITKNDAAQFYNLFNSNTLNLFKKDFEFLTHTNDTLLTKDKVSSCELFYKIATRIMDGFEKRNFDEVIEASNLLLETNPKDISPHFNNIGYALLQKKKYHEAIDYFTRAIDIDPYWDYPFNNRGYCLLQLGDIENAFIDLHHSFEMNPDNSFAWRNMGAYFLKINELDKAVKHFEKAEKIDPKTELIYFYLGQTYLKLGNMDKSIKFFNKSKELNEHNDSIIT
jgi:tetratricopeptide (TPR) repeat protein